MPYAPQIITQNRVPELMLQGAQAQGQMYANIGKSIGSGIQEYQQRKEANDKFNAKSKAMENLVKTHAELFGLGDPEKLKAALSTDPRESPIAKYERLSTMVEGTVVANKLKQAEEQRKNEELQRLMQIQAAQAKMAQAEEQRKNEELQRQMQQTQIQAAQAKMAQEQRSQAALSKALEQFMPQNRPSAAGEAVIQGGFGADIQGMSTAPRTVQPQFDPRQFATTALQNGATADDLRKVEDYMKIFGPPTVKPGAQEIRLSDGRLAIVQPNGNVTVANEPQKTYASPEEKAREANLLAKVEIDKKRLGDVYEGHKGAESRRSEIKRGIALLQDPEVYTGIGAGALLKSRQAAVALGVGDPKSISKAEELQSLLGTNMMSTIAQQTKGAISDREMSAFRDYSASDNKTKDGNLRIFKALERAADRAVQERLVLDKLSAKYESPGEILRALNDWREEHPIFTKEDYEVIGIQKDINAKKRAGISEREIPTLLQTPPKTLDEVFNKYNVK